MRRGTFPSPLAAAKLREAPPTARCPRGSETPPIATNKTAVGRVGIEPTTFGLRDRCTNQHVLPAQELSLAPPDPREQRAVGGGSSGCARRGGTGTSPPSTKRPGGNRTHDLRFKRPLHQPACAASPRTLARASGPARATRGGGRLVGLCPTRGDGHVPPFNRCRPLESNQDPPCFRRMRRPSTPERQNWRRWLDASSVAYSVVRNLPCRAGVRPGREPCSDTRVTRGAGRARSCEQVVPDPGIEPRFRGSEPRVLPLDESGAGAPGGSRTLNSRIKSSV